MAICSEDGQHYKRSQPRRPQFVKFLLLLDEDLK